MVYTELIKIVFLALISKVLGVSVDIDGQTYESLGLVGFGRIPADQVDKYHETVAPGSSVSVDQSTLKVDDDGIYHFTAWGLPDRGMNVDGTVNTYSRIHKYDVAFTPKNESSTDNIIWTYEDTILLTDFNGAYISGLDSNSTINYNGKVIPAVTYHGDGWGANLNSSTVTTRISLDSEALTLIDGSIDNGFWISDEYGPSIFKFDSNGKMVDYIQAIDANIPHVNGDVFFSSDNSLWWDQSYSPTPNENGRTANHGYEGMDISPDGKYLYTMLQSADVQDGGEKSKNRMNTRLLKYDITGESPELIGEYAVVLPTYEAGGKTKTASQSEMRIINENLIMALPRDSDLGHGGEDGVTAIYKHIDLWSLSEASNIVGKYDGTGEQISSTKGKLNSEITPAQFYSFIDMLDESELAKFGVHNGGANDAHLINEKWEALSLIPIQCTEDEYFLLALSDNDYKTTNGYLDFGNIQFDQGINVDTQSLMYHVKLPSLPHNKVCPAVSSSVVSSSSSLPASSSSSSASSSSASASSASSSSSAASSSVSSSASKTQSSSASSSSETNSVDATNNSIVSTTSSGEVSYTTYTTVVDNVTKTVVVPCSTTSSSSKEEVESSTTKEDDTNTELTTIKPTTTKTEETNTELTTIKPTATKGGNTNTELTTITPTTTKKPTVKPTGTTVTENNSDDEGDFVTISTQSGNAAPSSTVSVYEGLGNKAAVSNTFIGGLICALMAALV